MKITFLLLTLSWIPFLLFSQCQTQCQNYKTGTLHLGQLSYQNRGGYCEGFLGTGVGVTKGTLEPVSFTYGELDYPEERSVKIPIKANRNSCDIIRVEATGIPSDLFYRLDLCLIRGDTFTWDTGEVLIQESRTKYARNIGILGKCDKVFIPLLVGNSPDNSALTMIFISSKKISRVSWRVVNHHNELICVEDCQTIRKDFAIRILLPANLEPGEYDLEIQGMDPTSPATFITNKVKFSI